MIEASQFIDPAKSLGFDFWAGVPCSFLTPLINCAIADPDLTYISSANEGDAVAVASGAALAGHRTVAIMQNSGLGNAVSPLTSLNQVFRIPVLLIVTLRGEPGLADEPQHRLMGEITTGLLELMGIEWCWFPDNEADVENALSMAVAQMDKTGRPFAMVMKKGAVAACVLEPGPELVQRKTVETPARQHAVPQCPARSDVLRELVARTQQSETILIASTGFSGRELYAIEDRANHLYMVGSMGCASSLGLGLALLRPDKKIIVIDGDGAALMRLGNMATIGAYAGDNYYHLLLDNSMHESTGGQATVSTAVSFPAIASACGYRSVFDADQNSDLRGFLQSKAPAFMRVQTRQGVSADIPRPSLAPDAVARRLMGHMGVDAPWLVVSG